MTSEIDSVEAAPGTSRRTFLRRSAVVGGTLLWAAPTVQMLDLSASSASPVSGKSCVCTYPGALYFLCQIRSTPHGCSHSYGTGQVMGFEWTAGSGFVAPSGTDNPLKLAGVPSYDSSSTFYGEVLEALNKFWFLASVSQTSVPGSGGHNIPAYALKLTDLAFSPVAANGLSYCGYGVTNGSASVCSYNHDNPRFYDTYLFQGTLDCTHP